MFIYKRAAPVREWIKKKKGTGRRIGFVPTMGALHDGHISLVEKSKADTDLTVVSIFVNPRQFNDPKDLEKYPRPIEQDLRMLYTRGVDLVFVPDPEDIYPPGDTHSIDFDPGPAASSMEGKFRPGHFAGMAEVVYRLLDITTPDRLYMGQKDFQQFAIIRKLITDFHLPIDLVMCPTVREPNGLAMSSRNTRLSPEAREKASIIYRLLSEGKESFNSGEPIHQIQTRMLDALKNEHFEPEYVEVVDGYSLMPVTMSTISRQVVACCAVKVEDIRLIDNLIWKEI